MTSALNRPHPHRTLTAPRAYEMPERALDPLRPSLANPSLDNEAVGEGRRMTTAADEIHIHTMAREVGYGLDDARGHAPGLTTARRVEARDLFRNCSVVGG